MTDGNGGNGTGVELAERERNERQLIEILRAASALTPPELARRSGLSRSTVVSILGQLQDGDLVQRGPASPSGRGRPQGGRPASTVSLNPQAGAAMCIDFGHRHLRVALGDLFGRDVLDDPSQGLFAEEWDVDARAQESLAKAAKLAQQALDASNYTADQLVGVCVGIPAPVDQARGTLASQVVMKGWRGLRPGEELRQRLQWPTEFFIDNDANLALVAELEWGAAKEAAHVIYVKWASGIGAAFARHGRLWRGARNLAGEMHIPVPGLEKRTEPCRRCGRVDCLEAVAGGDAIARAMSTPGNQIRFSEIVEQAKHGPGDAYDRLRDAAEHLGRALAPLVTTLNPDLLVVGGLFDADLYPLLSEGLYEGLRPHTFPAALDDLLIRPGQRTDRAEAEGGIALVLRQELTEFLAQRIPTIKTS